jgi:hypothetical protein
MTLPGHVRSNSASEGVSYSARTHHSHLPFAAGRSRGVEASRRSSGVWSGTVDHGSDNARPFLIQSQDLVRIDDSTHFSRVIRVAGLS